MSDGGGCLEMVRAGWLALSLQFGWPQARESKGVARQNAPAGPIMPPAESDNRHNHASIDSTKHP
jgi:hypothetical protein